jgi:predicted metal-binding membrane protein
VVVIAALLAVIAASWAWILAGAGLGTGDMEMPVMDMSGMGMSDMAMPAAESWSLAYAALMFAMWWVMMVAMMLPSAAPMILLYARLDRRQRERGEPLLATGVFAAGYLVAWAAFSLAAASTQWALERTGLMSPAMSTTSMALAGGLLIAAGIYQMTPLKNACLRHCRSPVSFLSSHWRDGRRGALVMGLQHGAYCVGCCWVLMALLFVGGVMDLSWIAGLALLVLVEKLAPAGHWLGRTLGLGLVGWGAVVLAAA